MREIRTSGLTRGRVLPSLLYRFAFNEGFNVQSFQCYGQAEFHATESGAQSSKFHFQP